MMKKIVKKKDSTGKTTKKKASTTKKRTTMKKKASTNKKKTSPTKKENASNSTKKDSQTKKPTGNKKKSVGSKKKTTNKESLPIKNSITRNMSGFIHYRIHQSSKECVRIFCNKYFFTYQRLIIYGREITFVHCIQDL